MSHTDATGSRDIEEKAIAEIVARSGSGLFRLEYTKEEKTIAEIVCWAIENGYKFYATGVGEVHVSKPGYVYRFRTEAAKQEAENEYCFSRWGDPFGDLNGGF